VFRALDSATHNLLISMLGPLESHRLSLTSRGAYEAISSFRRRAFCIDKILAPFISDQSSFHRLMDTTGAVISGSQAVHFFERTLPNYEADLDVYVEQCSVNQLAFFLISKEGYFYIPKSIKIMTEHDTLSEDGTESEDSTESDDSTSYHSGSGIAGVYDLLHPNGKKIQLIAAIEATMTIILRFHSSTSQKLSPHIKY
jgi:hypothetical protein